MSKLRITSVILFLGLCTLSFGSSSQTVTRSTTVTSTTTVRSTGGCSHGCGMVAQPVPVYPSYPYYPPYAGGHGYSCGYSCGYGYWGYAYPYPPYPYPYPYYPVYKRPFAFNLSIAGLGGFVNVGVYRGPYGGTAVNVGVGRYY